MARARIVVEVNLDPVPGWGNNVQDWVNHVQGLMDRTVKHYNPEVHAFECERTEFGCAGHPLADLPSFGRTWCVVGGVLNAEGQETGGGVLEWCNSEEHAIERAAVLRQCQWLRDVYADETW